MIFPRPAHRHPIYRWAILIAVALLGALMTIWVSRSLLDSERERMEQRFQLAARTRADGVIAQMRQPLEDLATLQRLFGSIDHVDWPAFERITKPMLDHSGVRSYNWFPHVSGEERSAFERDGKLLWGERFAIEERDASGQPLVAEPRALYFPLLYSVPVGLGRQSVGYDLLATTERGPLVRQAIDSGLPTASPIGPMLIDRKQSDTTLIIAPVYRGGVVPLKLERRRAEAYGIAVVILNVRTLFSAANLSRPEVDFHVRLLDQAKSPPEILAVWNERLGDGPRTPADAGLVYSERLNVAGHFWSVQVEAAPSWIADNSPASLRLVKPLGLLATLLLLLYLHALRTRSALAESHAKSLEVSHADDVEQRQAAESWANKLLLAVDQSPASVYIISPEGEIEYVNEQFVDTTGYPRAQAIGMNTRTLRPHDADDLFYAHLWATVRGGSNWRGELQTRRQDGTLVWDRTLVSPIKDSEGTITQYMVIKEDITKLREVTMRFQESESRFRGAMSVMVEGLAIVATDGRFVFANRAADQLLGCPAGGIAGQRCDELPIERLREDGSRLSVEEYPTTITHRTGREVRGAIVGFRYPDATERWMQVNTSPLGVGTNGAYGVVMTLSDITVRRSVDEQLKLAYEAIRCSGEGILVTDAEHHIVSVNPAFEAVTGFSAQDLAGKTPADIAAAQCDENFYATMYEALETSGHWQGEIWNQRKSGETYPEWLGVSVVRGDDGRSTHYIYIFSDMTERKDAQRRIEFLAHHDPLTGLPNRLLLRDRVDRAQIHATRTHSRAALLYLDLDHFKTINDSLGHPVGDSLLRAVVERLKSCVRESDTISRQGGDEFIILLGDMRDSDAVARVADKIQQRMGEPFVLGNHSLNTSFSIGIALYPDDGEDFDSLLQKADTAMYHAKETGRNGHRFFTEQMNLQVVEHMRLQTELRYALENHEFVLHYQPQLDLRNGHIIGVEALIRWNRPDSELVPPGRFIGVAEDSGLIVPIGAWVLAEACRQARAWQSVGLPPFVVAVNLSAAQFKRIDLVATVINALVLSDLDAQWLELELTESILIQDAEVTLESLRRLKALGVKLSVDDFGTGYSSLTYLKRFAVDKLKIDRSFILDLISDPDDAAIVRAIIQMAQSLKLRTVAEGVESTELVDRLREYGCDEIQGYCFAYPMPADQLEAFVRAHEADKFTPRGATAIPI